MALTDQTSVLHDLSDLAVWLGVISVSAAVAFVFATSVKIGVSACRQELRISSHTAPRLTKAARHLADLVTRSSSEK
jgi:hypothetical protein